MTAVPVYTLSVPSVPDSVTVLEDLCDIYLARVPGLDAEATQQLRLSVAEACRNALSMPAVAGRVASVRVSFFRDTARPTGPRISAMEIGDPGAGVEIEGHRPPYPRSLVGRRFRFLDVLDYTLYCVVDDAITVHFTAEAQIDTPRGLTREELLSRAQPRGLGLLALCRSWEVVEFRHRADSGTVLRLESPLAVPVGC